MSSSIFLKTTDFFINRCKNPTQNQKHVSFDLATIEQSQAYGKMSLTEEHCKRTTL
jgi:hypothetical protein